MSWAPVGSTRVAAVIGNPIGHSLSPALHNAAFRDADLDWVYVAFSVAAGSAASALEAMVTLNLGGLSVTMPHKRDVAARCSQRSADAQTLQSVNCVVPLAGGQLLGESTDGEGFVRSLRDADVDVKGRSVVLLGAGGAASAVALALARHGAQVAVHARKAEAAASIAALHASIAPFGWEAREASVSDAEIIVNCTPLGMLGDTNSPIALASIRTGQVVCDLVYTPIVTPLLCAASERGAQTVDGLGMLIHQAALAFELWTGVVPDTEVMRAAALVELARRAP